MFIPINYLCFLCFMLGCAFVLLITLVLEYLLKISNNEKKGKVRFEDKTTHTNEA